MDKTTGCAILCQVTNGTSGGHTMVGRHKSVHLLVPGLFSMSLSRTFPKNSLKEHVGGPRLAYAGMTKFGSSLYYLSSFDVHQDLARKVWCIPH